MNLINETEKIKIKNYELELQIKNLQEKINSIQQILTKYEELENNLECIICNEYFSTIVFIPCNHFCTCKFCSSTLKACPICKQNIIKKISTFVNWNNQKVINYNTTYKNSS